MLERVRPLGPDEALAEASAEGGGEERARCLVETLAARGKLWLCRLDRDDLLNLVWQEDDHTRQLTSAAADRTVGAVARRLLDEYGSLRLIAEATPVPGQLDPEWFTSSVDIAEHFDWAVWSKPWLVPAAPGEARGNRDATLYVCEGVHRTLAIATCLLEGTVAWTRIEAIVADERPRECC